MVDSDRATRANGPGLEVRGLSVSYGGNLAVEKVDLEAPLGRVTGLIGPNGAGKTTTFNVCNGLLKPSEGSVRLFGDDVTSLGAAQRGRMGLGRTFQRVEICEEMTVAANVQLALEARIAGKNPLGHLRARRSEQTAVAAATEAGLAQCGLSDAAGKIASTLSTGQRRLLELARVLAGGYQQFLLDEPSSGLDEEETTEFGRILSSATADRGLGVLLVEHDMRLVMSVCEYIYVLDFGRMIFHGTPAEVQASDLVRAAYLGQDDAYLETTA